MASKTSAETLKTDNKYYCSCGNSLSRQPALKPTCHLQLTSSPFITPRLQGLRIDLTSLYVRPHRTTDIGAEVNGLPVGLDDVQTRRALTRKYTWTTRDKTSRPRLMLKYTLTTRSNADIDAEIDRNDATLRGAIVPVVGPCLCCQLHCTSRLTV